MSANQISSLDEGYIAGDLSVFPDALDDKESLYEAKNNAETTLKKSLSYNAKYIIVNSTDGFPDSGLLRVGLGPGIPGDPELIYYGNKSDFIFKNLIRGFSNSKQNSWPTGAGVTSSVMAEHHNAVKDALINIQHKVGNSQSTSITTLTGAVRDLEAKYLSAKAAFRAYPTKGPPPLYVRFQDFSSGDIVRFLWDFGDGNRSIEKSPNHIYVREGIYTVKLNIITSTGGQGICTKPNYITVSETERLPFFYVTQNNLAQPAYSIETADSLVQSGENLDARPAVFCFIDQTDGDIMARYWVFGDGETETVDDPNKHDATHTYELPGEYEPMLLLVYNDDVVKRAFLSNTLVVI
jgi:PKD repeat protein